MGRSLNRYTKLVCHLADSKEKEKLPHACWLILPPEIRI
jgi:hypothetical protein